MYPWVEVEGSSKNYNEIDVIRNKLNEDVATVL